MHAADGTLSTPELAGGPWTNNQLSQVDLDHVDHVCQDLETRSWWSSAMTAVPQVMEYIDASVQPPTSTTHRLILCPSGALYVNDWYGTYTGTYTLEAGHVDAQLRGSSSTAGAIYAQGYFENGTDTPDWMQTSEEAAAAARFCASGVFSL